MIPDRWNPIELRRSIEVARIQKVLTVRDITDPKQQPMVTPAKAPKRNVWGYDFPNHVSLEDAGFTRQPPAHTYVVRLDASLEASDDGQTLGYTWLGIVETWHQRAFTSFGDGHGVWESGAGLLLPFHARNFKDVTQWAVALTRAQLMPSIRGLEFPFPVAVKTGTSQAYHDNWTIGYTREVTVGVWVGNFDRSPLTNSSGVTGAGPIFHAVMLAAQRRVAGHLLEPDADRKSVV